MSGKMATRNQCKTPEIAIWLQRFLVLDEHKRIKLDDIHSLISGTTGKKINRSGLGKIIKATFPSVTQSRASLGGKKSILYTGISFNPCYTSQKEKENIITDLSEVPSIPFVSELGFFKLKSEGETCLLGFMNDVRVNDIDVLSKVSIKMCDTLSVSLSVFGENFDTKALGAENLPFTRNSLKAVLEIISRLSFCHGYNKSYWEQGGIKVVKEKWQRNKSPPQNVYRSSGCKRVIFCRSDTVCRNCQQQKKRSRTSKVQADIPVEDSKKHGRSLNTASNGQTHNTKTAVAVEDIEGSSNDESDGEAGAGTPVLSDDLTTQAAEMIEQLFPGLEDIALRVLIESQVDNRCKDEKRQYRWSPRIMQLCLLLCDQSPYGYDDLRQNGFLILPSVELLQYYKNSVHQQPGIQAELMTWMRREADKQPQQAREGELIFDEMAMQITEGSVDLSKPTEEEDVTDDGEDVNRTKRKQRDVNRAKRKKLDRSQLPFKKPKLERPVQFQIYVESASEERLKEPMDNLFKSNNIEVTEVTVSEEKSWFFYGQATLAKREDQEKLLQLNGQEVDGRQVCVEVIPEPD